MSQIEDLQSRITAAIERIGGGISALTERAEAARAAAQAATEAAEDVARDARRDPDAALVAELDEEKMANAQLHQRLRLLKDRHAQDLAELETRLQAAPRGGLALETLKKEVAAQSEAMARLDGDVQRLRQSNDQLRAANAALREANAEGVGEPHLINKAMLAELEGLRAARATDAAEAGVVLAKLESLIGNARNLPNGEDE